MTIALDLYAETNPAFGLFTTIGFCRNFVKNAGRPPDIALLYLAIPIAMSGDTQKSFSETNARTGLHTWLTRYPQIRIDLGARLDASLHVVSDAVKLGLSSRVLVLRGSGLIELSKSAPAQTRVARLPVEPKQTIQRAERLGIWMAKAGTTASIFSTFGVSL